jgi:uncharacterized membrane-anchored protein YitT (DUF2179 family)
MDKPGHTTLEDAQGLAYGVTMASVAVTILTHLGLITGQTAGLAVLLSYVTGLPFGVLFFALNLPFYWFGYRRLGLAFTAKTFTAVAALSALSTLVPGWISFATLDPLFGALLAGLLSGSALLAIFRHGGSLGGIGILGLWLQDRTGFRAGHLQLTFDAALFTAALFILPPLTVALSFAGALATNLVIAINHRREWYIAS